MAFRQARKSIAHVFLAVSAALVLPGIANVPESRSSLNRMGNVATQKFPVIQGSIAAAAVGRDGTLYLVEENGREIYQFTPDGRFLVLAGKAEDSKNSWADGPGDKARFCSITGMVLDSQNRLHVLDSVNNVLRIVDSSGMTTTLAGKPLFEENRIDGFRGWARFENLIAVTKGPQDFLYLIDGSRGNGRQYFRKITPDGYVSTISVLPLGMKVGGAKGDSRDVDWNCLAADSSGGIYLGATEERILIKISPHGLVMDCFAAPIPRGESSPPAWWLAAGPRGYLYLADSKFGVFRMNSRGTWEKYSGTRGREILAESAPNESSESIESMVTDSRDRLILIKSDEGGSRWWIERLNPAVWAWRPEVLRKGTGKLEKPDWIWRKDDDDEDSDLIPKNPASKTLPVGLSKGMLARRVRDVDEDFRRLAEDPEALASFYGAITGGEGIDPMTWVYKAIGRNVAPSNIVVDSQDNVLVGDAMSGAVIRISPQGKAEVLAIVPRDRDETDDRRRRAHFHISVSPSGSVFVTDSEKEDLFRELLPEGRWNIFWENWIGKWTDSNRVDRLLFDSKGNVYLAPQHISGRARTEDMLKVTLEGDFEFLPLKSERLTRSSIPASVNPAVIDVIVPEPSFSLAFDGRSGFYAACPGEHVIRKRAADGTLEVFAGRPLQPGRADGSSAEARFFFPFDAAADREGNVFVADTFNHAIRNILPDGTVLTLAGRAGAKGFRNGKGPDALFDTPSALALARDGSLYVFDQEGSAVRKVTRSGEVTTLFSEETLSGQAADVKSSRAVREKSLLERWWRFVDHQPTHLNDFLRALAAEKY